MIQTENEVKKYDFVLFENAYDIENHYKDLSLLAKILKKAGYTVAIANVFKEAELCLDTDIPHIDLKYKCPRRFSILRKYRKTVSSFSFHLNRLLHSLYLVYVIIALRKNASNFYIGSLTTYTPVLFLCFLPRKNNYFIWGLRSYTLTKWANSKYDTLTFTSWLRERRIKNHRNVKLIVSNEVIREEFISIGIKRDRTLYRPERWIAEGERILDDKKVNDRLTNILSIGTLRRSKHVEYAIEALQKINDKSIVYTIAGRCKDTNGYEAMITEKSKGMPNVVRKNYFIDDNEYVQLFKECDFLLLCDEPEPSCGSNGTMLESIMVGRPLIAPNHSPFKEEIERFGVGILYDLNDINSLVVALNKAKELKSLYFKENIKKYQEFISERNIINSLIKELSIII